jgi:hypothetical protein
VTVSRVQCLNCNEYGHFKTKCQNQPAADLAGGGDGGRDFGGGFGGGNRHDTIPRKENNTSGGYDSSEQKPDGSAGDWSKGNGANSWETGGGGNW